jgi:hypothetical protein
MNSRQDGPPRRPAGPSPASVRSLRTLVAETTTPSPMSSPAIRRHPHRGFSRARRRTSSRTSRLIPGRPGRRPGYVQRRATSRRCHPSSVSGVTKNQRHRSRGSSRLAGGEEHPVRGPQCRASRLPAQHRELMAEHHDLKLLVIGRAKAQQHKRHRPAKDHVQKRRQQRTPPILDRARDPTHPENPRTPTPPTIGFTHPTGEPDLLSPSRR